MTAHQEKNSCVSCHSSSVPSTVPDIEDVHTVACHEGSKIYLDPVTGLTCWTEVAHLQRGVCCGNKCRHCPYGWENVAGNNNRPAKLKSRDKVKAKELLNEILVAGEKGNSTQERVGSKENLTGGVNGGTLTSKNVPYTRSGDKGQSRLPSGSFRPKNDSVFEAMGTVDELCSVVGVCHSLLAAERGGSSSPAETELKEQLVDVMSRLFDIGSQIAAERSTNDFFDEATSVKQLEDWIDLMTQQLPELTSFILPTGSVVAAQLHVARTVCRRAERQCPPNRYLNRLSDFLFTAARLVNQTRNEPEILYRKPDAGSRCRQAQERKDHEP